MPQSMNCVQDRCQQCLWTVEDLCQQCLCTVPRTCANNVYVLCSGLCQQCVLCSGLSQQCLCTVFRTCATDYVLCTGPLPTMSMYCVQDLRQQCLYTVFKTYANNVYALCSGPMPAAHAEQGLGEARATARGLAHRQRVRVGSPQSLQSLLHLLLVSHRSFLSSLSSSVHL